MSDTGMNRPARNAEPMIVTAMHRRPGILHHRPNDPQYGGTGTSSSGFLSELEEYVQARIQLALAERKGQ